MSKSMAAFLLLCFGCFSFDVAVAENADLAGYQYSTVPSGASIRLDSQGQKIILDGHNVINAHSCSLTSEFKCLIGGDFFIVFPKADISEKSAWEYEGKRFNVVNKIRGQILGRNYSAFLIQQQFKNGRYWYLYSSTEGLLAFGLVSKAVKSAFFLEGYCGYGATKSSIECQSSNIKDNIGTKPN